MPKQYSSRRLSVGRLARFALGATATLAAFTIVRDARAQAVDVQRPWPNVLLLLDNSGSMERMIDGTTPEANVGAPVGGPFNACNPNVQTNPNRWGVALQSMTGNITPYFSCFAQPRTTATTVATPAGNVTLNMSFADEYKINGKPPYDQNYFLPYHRPLAGNCTYAPGVLAGAPTGQGVGPNGDAMNIAPGQFATDWIANGIVQKDFRTAHTTTGTNPGCFTQNADGVLDSVRDFVRLGLMTFDTDPAAGTGVTVSTSPLVVTTAPFDGMWSYYPGWNGTGGSPTAASGNFPACATSLFEVGARNPGAPQWEGRFIKFPATDAITDIRTNNDNIQSAVNALRPYGATPIAGMMQDASYYFLNDPSGPRQADPFVQGGCRDQYIILLTDGAPNQDMRPTCSLNGGACPYIYPEQTASNLFNGATGSQVTTYVIGFAVSTFSDQGSPAQCSSLVIPNPTPHLDVAQCSVPNPSQALQACCNLQKIAIAGGSTNAYFADSPGALNQAFNDIFGKILTNVTTRTGPAYSPIVASGAYDTQNQASTTPASSTFLSAFNPNIGRPWSGDVQRQRSICTAQGQSFVVPAPVVDFSKGDDFASNVNSTIGLGQRKFLAIKPGASDQNTMDATMTIRPFVAPGPPSDPGVPADGIGLDPGGSGVGYGAVQLGPTISAIKTGLVPGSAPYTPNALNIGATQAECKSVTGFYLNASECSSRTLNFLFGASTSPPLAAPNGTNSMDSNGFFPFVSRYCTQGCTGASPNRSAIGAVYHATPAVVGPPSAFLRDESYEQFRNNNSLNYHGNAGTSRPTVVYVATIDGLLHAFDANVATQANNELWAFLPPAVMPMLVSEYSAAQNQLLDGAPIVKDVVFQRSRTAGSPVTVDPTIWHTMLVAGFGPKSRGYYAMDVTDPDGTNIPTGGPKFQWQIAKMGGTAPNNGEIFGQQSGTPAIGTVFADLTGAHAPNLNPSEYGVAILPGGAETGVPTGASCARTGGALNTTMPKPSDSQPSGGAYAARVNVRCWGAEPVVGRSVAVVNIKTGEIIRVFMRLEDLPTTHPLRVKGRVIDTRLDSPMTGVPIVYPNDTGAIAQKFFMSDADGTIWRFDLTNADPDLWTGELFYDMFNPSAYPATSFSAGQPVNVAPVIALDRTGSLVLIASSGDQESYATTGVNFTVSLTETVQGTITPKLRANVNWWVQHNNGERVSGPMVVFDSIFYMATFAPNSGSASCSLGTPKIWGMDFQLPAASANPQNGGKAKLDPALNGTFVQFTDPTTTNPQAAGHVIPGVSINQTPACASAGAGSFDGYVAGASHSAITNSTGASYSLFASFGGKGTGTNAVNTFNQQLRTPRTVTVVDSWAGVVE